MMISQFGINMLVPVFICSFAGMWLDKKLGTDFLIIIFFHIVKMAKIKVCKKAIFYYFLCSFY